MTEIDKAIAIRAEAVNHKRLSKYHREQARLAMERLRLFCEAHNIPIVHVIANGGIDEKGNSGT